MAGPPIVTLTRSFGANVRRIRGERGWTQGELAEQAGLEPRSIRAIEAAEHPPSFESIVRLAWALDVEVGVLFKAAKHQRQRRGRPRKP